MIANVEFPFAYVWLTEALLVVHFLLTPLVVCTWVGTSAWAAVFSFVPIFTLWSMNSIAHSLDNPFSDENKSIDCEYLHADFNRRLLSIYPVTRMQTPAMSPEANSDLFQVQSGLNACRQARLDSGRSGMFSRTMSFSSKSTMERQSSERKCKPAAGQSFVAMLGGMDSKKSGRFSGRFSSWLRVSSGEHSLVHCTNLGPGGGPSGSSERGRPARGSCETFASVAEQPEAVADPHPAELAPGRPEYQSGGETNRSSPV